MSLSRFIASRLLHLIGCRWPGCRRVRVYGWQLCAEHLAEAVEAVWRGERAERDGREWN